MTEKKSKGAAEVKEQLPRIPMERVGSRVVRISLEDARKAKSSIESKKGSIASESSQNSDATKKSLMLNRQSYMPKKSRVSMSSKSKVSESEFDIPAYLDPQPKFFKSHLAEDMIIETFDPLADSEEEDEIVEEVVVQEYDDDFDYESLYADDKEGSGDDADDFIPPPTKETHSSLLIVQREEEEEEDGGDDEEEGGTGGQIVEETLSDCDDRSDDAIERDRVVKDLYDAAFADTASVKSVIKESMSAEPPSITQKSLDEYFVDREEEKINRYKDEYQGWFYTCGSEVLYRRKIQACLDSILVKERIKYKGIKDEFKTRWELGQAKQVIVDQALVKFDGYYKETLTKRNRAVQQTSYEMAQRILKLHEINRYNKELECLLRIQEEGEKRLERFRIFERYLEKVRDESRGEFSDIRDIIDRYGVLSQARSGLISRDLKNQDKIERAQANLKRTMDLRSNELLVYNNYLSELRVYRDNLMEEILKLEEMLLHIKQTAASRTLIIGQIKLAINNLYLGLCRQLGRAGRIPPEDTFRQLSYVKTSMKEIVKLSKDVKKMLQVASHQAAKEKREKARIEIEGKRKKFRKTKSTKVNDFRAIFGFTDDT